MRFNSRTSACQLQRLPLFALLLSLGLLSAALARETGFEIPPDEKLPGAGPIHRADWFQNVWRERRSRWATEIEQDQGAVVFLGDSITQGWKDLAQTFSGVKVANRGIGGDTTRGVLYRLPDDVLSLNPSGVVLLIGTNDIGFGNNPELNRLELIVSNFKLIIEKLSAHDPEMPIIVCLIMPSSEKMSRGAEAVRRTNELYAEAVRGNEQVTVLDTYTLFANQQGNAKQEEFPDLLHPNEQGYAKWAAALRPLLATVGLLETEPDEFELEPGFESLFNGHDLTGWGLRPTPQDHLQDRANWRREDPNAPTWPVITEIKPFDGQIQSDSGRYLAKNGRLIVTTPTEGRRIEQLWTMREFPDDFELKLEFRATPNADSGIYLRGKQLQCRDFWLAGPYTKLKSYRPQEWNEIHVVVRGNTAHCTCNGEVLEEAYELPDTGPIGLEGDRGQMEYRRIRVKSLD